MQVLKLSTTVESRKFLNFSDENNFSYQGYPPKVNRNEQGDFSAYILLASEERAHRKANSSG